MKLFPAENIYIDCSTFYWISISKIFFYLQTLTEEEHLMDHDITQYPALQLIMATKEPFDRLWKTALNFNNSYDQWMNGKALSTLTNS